MSTKNHCSAALVPIFCTIVCSSVRIWLKIKKPAVISDEVRHTHPKPPPETKQKEKLRNQYEGVVVLVFRHTELKMPSQHFSICLNYLNIHVYLLNHLAWRNYAYYRLHRKKSNYFMLENFLATSKAIMAGLNVYVCVESQAVHVCDCMD